MQVTKDLPADVIKAQVAQYKEVSEVKWIDVNQTTGGALDRIQGLIVRYVFVLVC